MNRTLESIFKDIEVLGIKGGYDVEQLITPNDCRILKGEIIDLQSRIDKVIECLEEGIDFPYYDDDTKKYLKGMKDILKGGEENE